MKTTKEKANEIFNQYYIICQEYTEEIQCSIQAKQCALIAVDELIKQENKYNNGSFYPSKYWQEVKQEILSL